MLTLAALLGAACGNPNSPPPPPPLPAPAAEPTAVTPPTAAATVPDPPPAPGAVDPGSGAATDLAYCVDETNRYRALAGVAPVAAADDVKAYAAAAARADGASGTAHGYTNGAGRPAGAFAENEAVRWSLAQHGSVRQAIAGAMAAFWAEGAGGGHYENLRGPWQVVGCGVFVDGDRVTIVQHFR